MPPQTTSETRRRKMELVLRQLGALPTLPAVAVRLLQLATSETASANEVVRLIESDPSLSSKLLTLVTRADTGISRKSATVNRAVVMLGFDAVRNLALSVKVFETLGGVDDAPETGGFDKVGFWKHSLGVACASRRLCRMIDRKLDPEEAFLCGLLHGIGKIALATALPKSYLRVIQAASRTHTDIAEVERVVLGIDHNQAGKRLTELWSLPNSIMECAWLYNHPINSLPGSLTHANMVKTVHMAELLARQLYLGFSGNVSHSETLRSLSEELACPSDKVERITRQLPQEVSERAVLLGIDHLEPETLYHEALELANTELGQLNWNLIEKSRQLAHYRRYCDMIISLHDCLRNKQTVMDICQVIAEHWQQYLGVTRCAAFAISPDHRLIEGARTIHKPGSSGADAPGQDDSSEGNHLCSEVFAFDLNEPTREAPFQNLLDDIGAMFTIRRIGDEEDYRWFFEQCDDSYNPLRTWTIPFIIDGERIGGLLWEVEGLSSSDDLNRKQGEYNQQRREIQAFGLIASQLIMQAQMTAKTETLCESMAQLSRELHEHHDRHLTERSLAMVGEMACGTAHEINNPLAVIVGRAQMLAESETDPTKRQTLETIVSHAHEATEIITELIDLAEPTKAQPEPIGIEDLLAELLEEAGEWVSEQGHEIVTEIGEHLPPLQANRNQLREALIELLRNAAGAYRQEGGRILIQGDYEPFNHQLTLVIADQGVGMSEETLANLFTPFFSHEKAGRRRGLGLTRAKARIEGNGGTLRIESAPEQGTRVHILFPLESSELDGELDEALEANDGGHLEPHG